nr:MAG TPA: hypothetical protein [Caudoviricetes sp.]
MKNTRLYGIKTIGIYNQLSPLMGRYAEVAE